MSCTDLDLATFAVRAGRAKPADAARVARATRSLVDGALRIRRGNDGLYGDVLKPVTKPAEAIGAWLRSIEREVDEGAFHRAAELREAMIAAGEEVDAATRATPAAERLRGALYSDALDLIGGPAERPAASMWQWVVDSVLAVALVGGADRPSVSRQGAPQVPALQRAVVPLGHGSPPPPQFRSCQSITSCVAVGRPVWFR